MSGLMENIKNMDVSKLITNMNSQLASAIIFTIVFVLLVVMLVKLYLSLNLESSECNRMDRLYSTVNGKIRPISINENDSQLGYSLRDYYIKSSYNACSGGGYKNDVVSTCNLIDVIKQGVRLFDFEIYSLNDVPIVATSNSESYFVKETYNQVNFSDVMSTIVNYAYSNATCPNPNDPILLHLRIKSTNDAMYQAMAKIFEFYDNYMLGTQYSFENGGQNLGSIKLLDLVGKIIIIVEKDNTAFMENSDFYEYVNMTSNSVFMRAIKYYDAKFTYDMSELIEYNKQNMTLVKPDSGENPDNCSAILTRTFGCQMTCMRYQLDDEFLKEDTAFFDACGYAFALKPKHLRYIPVIIPDPPAPDPKLSYASRTLEKPYYKFKI
jgi:hypothetical protein